MPGGEPTDGILPEGVLEPQEQPVSPAGSLPGNTNGWITAASTARAFASGSDACSYTCWYRSKIIYEA